MAIEIIPKLPEKEPIWFNILFYLALGLLVASILSYFLLLQLQKEVQKSIEDLEKSILLPRDSAEQELGKKIPSAREKIDDFAFVFQNHRALSHTLPLLEAVTHPKVKFSEFTLSENALQLKGTAESYIALGQQLSILRLQKDRGIPSAQISDVSLGREGDVGFSLNLEISPEIFKFE